MSQFEKLIQRVRSIDRSLRFEELAKVLEAYGYTGAFPGNGSSHCTFRKPGKSIITIPTGRPVNIAYIKMVRDIVEKEEKHEQDD